MDAGPLYTPRVGDKVRVTDIHSSDAFFDYLHDAQTAGILMIIVAPGPSKHLSGLEGGWWALDATLLQPIDNLDNGDRITFFACRFKMVKQAEPVENLTRWELPLELEPP